MPNTNSSGNHPQVDPVTIILGAFAALRPAARRWSSDPASAEDLLHDTLERALRNLHRFEAGTCARAWLATIMYRLAVDASRRLVCEGQLRARYRVEIEPQICMPEEDSPEHTGTPDADGLRAMADRLAEPFKSTFLLWAIDHLSYREISSRTGSPVGTVATRLMRARIALRGRLEQRL